jgi:hypothetical protein
VTAGLSLRRRIECSVRQASRSDGRQGESCPTQRLSYPSDGSDLGQSTASVPTTVGAGVAAVHVRCATPQSGVEMVSVPRWFRRGGACW